MLPGAFIVLGLSVFYAYYGQAPVVEAAFLGFKFWLDEPGIDGMCYFTENHQILFHVTGYLSGQYWRERTFANSGLTGQQQMARALPRIKSRLEKLNPPPKRRNIPQKRVPVRWSGVREKCYMTPGVTACENGARRA